MFHMTMKMEDLQTAENYFLALPTTCRMVGARACLFTVIDSTDTLITFSDGTTTIGVITIPFSGCAEGDITDIVIDTTSDGKVELGGATELKLALGGEANSTGDAMITMTFDEFHAAN